MHRNGKMTDFDCAAADWRGILGLTASNERGGGEQRFVAHEEHLPEADAGAMRRPEFDRCSVQPVNRLDKARVVRRFPNGLKIALLRGYIFGKAHSL